MVVHAEEPVLNLGTCELREVVHTFLDVVWYIHDEPLVVLHHFASFTEVLFVVLEPASLCEVNNL